MLERWTRAVIRFRLLVLAIWGALAVAGALSAVQLPGLLSNSLSVPGTSSDLANGILRHRFDLNPEGTFTVVFKAPGLPHETAAQRRAALLVLERRVSDAAAVIPSARTRAMQTEAGVAYGDVVTPLDIQQAGAYTSALRAALARRPGPHAYVTGEPAIEYDLNAVLASDLRRGESVALPIAFLMLALVVGFRPVLIVPLLFAICSITSALAVVYAVAHEFLMVAYVPNLVELIGLGLAIDYSLLIVQRFREQVAEEGRTVDDAVVATMATAGRAVLFSGAAVAIGLSAVLIMPVPFMRSMGFAGVVVPLVSMVAALTLQPAVLSLLGRWGVRGLPLPGLQRAGVLRQRFWAALALGVMRRRSLGLALAAVILAALALPAIWLRLTPGLISTIPSSTQSSQGLTFLRDRVGPGAITPVDVVIDSGRLRPAQTPAVTGATLRLARQLLPDPEVFVVAIGEKAPYVDRTGRYRRIIIYPRHEFGSQASQALIRRVRHRFVPAAHFPAGTGVWTGGAAAQGVDFLGRVYESFPWIVLAVLALSYVVLLRAFRSLLLPLIALLLDLVSVCGAYGMLVLVFQLGIGARLLGLYQVPEIEGWIPVFLFAALFGLSMDYEVFLVTRMRECWDQGQDSAVSVAQGLERTGRVVTAAAVIMVAAFSGFMFGRVAGLQELGVGLALGVLLDATVVRMLLLPSLMAMLGRWNWWLPAPVARLVMVEASPLAGSERRGPSRSARATPTSPR